MLAPAVVEWVTLYLPDGSVVPLDSEQNSAVLMHRALHSVKDSVEKFYLPVLGTYS